MNNIDKILESKGLAGVELTYNIMNSYKDNIRPFSGVSIFNAIKSGLPIFGSFGNKKEEGYYLNFSKFAKEKKIKIPLILVGGIRSTYFMQNVLENNYANFFSLARPIIREPDLPNKLRNGRKGEFDCVSCNMCFQHEGIHGTKS